MLAIGLMSGTSLDGLDAALIETDGRAQVRSVAFLGTDYSDAQRRLLREATEQALTLAVPEPTPQIQAATDMLTAVSSDVVARLLVSAAVAARDVGVIGFHGQTVAHRPDRGWTWQIGDGAALAAAIGIHVVNDLRSADVAAGGQGAPLLPIYHAALSAGLTGPVAVLNLGGVANITYIPAGGADDGAGMIAFDTGPANGLIDAWIEGATGARFDAAGALAATGRVNEAVLAAMLDHPFFDQPHPKSLDRHDFTIQPARGLSAADGAATLTAFTAETVATALHQLPGRPAQLIVVGGGRHNPTLLAMIAGRTGLTPVSSEALGWNGDAIEAEGFAYMAVRSLTGLPISFPGTTGVAEPLTGGILHRLP